MNQEAERMFYLDNTSNNSNLSRYDKNQDSIYSWANKYYCIFVLNSPFHTQRAKKSDLDKFLSYFTSILKTLLHKYLIHLFFNFSGNTNSFRHSNAFHNI